MQYCEYKSEIEQETLKKEDVRRFKRSNKKIDIVEVQQNNVVSVLLRIREWRACKNSGTR